MRFLPAFLTVFSLFLMSMLSPPVQAEGFGKRSFTAINENVTAPLEVVASLKIDQITFVDQQSENFGVVANLIFQFSDPALAFDPQEFGGQVLGLTPDEYRDYSRERGVIIPFFVVQNQQGRRFTQQEQIVVHSDGRVTYFERFTATLQAPHFNFRKYPFDRQKFYLEVAAIFPATHVQFTANDEISGLGDLLGEEEWVLRNPQMSVREIEGVTGQATSMVVLGFDAHRHVQYYLLRIMLPLLIILIASWATFFLEEYRRRIDMANANLLVFVAFNFAISTSLPKLGYLTFMDSLFVGMFIITGSMVLVNIALRRLKIVDKEALARKIDRYLVIWVYPLMYAGFLFWAVKFFLI